MVDGLVSSLRWSYLRLIRAKGLDPEKTDDDKWVIGPRFESEWMNQEEVVSHMIDSSGLSEEDIAESLAIIEAVPLKSRT